MIVDAFGLLESTSNEPSLVTRELSFLVAHTCKDPLTANHLAPVRMRHDLECADLIKSFHFKRHRLQPLVSVIGRESFVVVSRGVCVTCACSSCSRARVASRELSTESLRITRSCELDDSSSSPILECGARLAGTIS